MKKIKRLNEKENTFPESEYVKHPVFGVGKVKEIDIQNKCITFTFLNMTLKDRFILILNILKNMIHKLP